MNRQEGAGDNRGSVGFWSRPQLVLHSPERLSEVRFVGRVAPLGAPITVTTRRIALGTVAVTYAPPLPRQEFHTLASLGQPSVTALQRSTAFLVLSQRLLERKVSLFKTLDRLLGTLECDFKRLGVVLLSHFSGYRKAAV